MTVPLSAPQPLTAVGDTLAITAFTAANPTVATVDSADTAKIVLADTWTLAAGAGDTNAMAVIDGQTVTVASMNGSDATLDGVDLSTSDVTALTATATVARPDQGRTDSHELSEPRPRLLPDSRQRQRHAAGHALRRRPGRRSRQPDRPGAFRRQGAGVEGRHEGQGEGQPGCAELR